MISRTGLSKMKPVRSRVFTWAVILCLMLLVAGTQRASTQTNGLHKGDVLAGADFGHIYQFGPDGSLLGTLDTTTGSSHTTGMCFDSSGDLYVTTFDNNAVSKFDNTGSLVNGSFASGLSEPESCVVDAAGDIYVGQAGGNKQIIEFNSDGGQIGSFSPAPENIGTDWIALASDQCTMFYTSEGNNVKRYDVCKDVQLPDFTSAPLSGPCFALRIRPNGEVMVACSSVVYRIDPTGNVIQFYPGFGQGNLFALNLDPDGTSFWTGDLNGGTIYKIDISSGASLIKPIRVDTKILGGLAVVGEIAAAQLPPTPTPTPAPYIPPPPPVPPQPNQNQNPSLDPFIALLVFAIIILLVLGVIGVVGVLVIILIVRVFQPKKVRPQPHRAVGWVEKHEDMGQQVMEVSSDAPVPSVRLHLVQGEPEISIEFESPDKPRENGS